MSKPSSRPLSIIIPHFSKQDALQKTWDELILQIHPEDTITIVDDHSPDGVPEFDCECTEVIKPPKLSKHIYRLNTLRNYGIEHAKHDPCIIIDADCVPHTGFLDHARIIFDPSVLFTGWVWYIDETGDIRKEIRQTTRTPLGKSVWIDKNSEGCRLVLGGCMYFSKKRASLAGLFNTSYDGTWGYAEHDFASACYNSGMRLRFEAGLIVVHQWHQLNQPGNKADNDRLLRDNMKAYRKNLNHFTPYQPAVAVLMVSMMRPYYIDQGMRAIFRHTTPFKVRLVNNGDQSPQQLDAMNTWKDRWAVDYVDYDTRELLSTIRTKALRDYKKKKYKYLIMLDDDITPKRGSLNNLILEMEKHPEYHALCGYITEWTRTRFIGGRIFSGRHFYHDPVVVNTIPADYISSGFTIIRLKEVVPYPDDWEMGWNDWCWSNEVMSRGLKLGVTGMAGAYHRQLFTAKGIEQKEDSPEYRKIRYDKDRHNKMAEKFKQKWGYTPKPVKSIRNL